VRNPSQTSRPSSDRSTTSREPTSATEIADRCDASVSTVYRRAERLQEVGLVTACELTFSKRKSRSFRAGSERQPDPHNRKTLALWGRI
jgi:DNA-binding Lrp family transcriptional regulator